MRLWRAEYAVSRGSAEGHDERPDDVRVVAADFYMASEADVRRFIAAGGGWPISISVRRQQRVTLFETRSTAWQLQLLRSLRFQSANASAGTALGQIIEDETDASRRLAALPARAVLRGGGTFATALKAMHLFDAPTIAIIAAGERAGEMRSVIAYAIAHIEEAQKQIRLIRVGLGWLAFDLVSVVSTLIGTQWGYIPYLRESGITSRDPAAVERFHGALDTASLLNGAVLAGNVLMVAAGGIVAWAYWRNRGNPGHWSAGVVRRIPAFGRFLYSRSLADTARTMARLARSSVPLDEALAIVAGSAMSPQVSAYWRSSLDRVRGGMKPQRALAMAPLNRVEQGQVASYETTQQLAEVMDALAEEREIEAKSAQRAIVQLGIAVLGGIMALVFAISLWLVSLQNDGMLESIKSLRN